MEFATMDYGVIESIVSYSNEFVSFVHVITDSGLQGWGQTSTYNADITSQVLHRQVAPWVLGQSANDIAALVKRVEEKEHKFPGSYRLRAFAGVDTALWDLKGKAEGKPVVELLGGEPCQVRAYASSMRRDISPTLEAERFVKLRDQCGFDAFKWRVGSECGHDQDEWPGRTAEVITTVSKALGDNCAKLVDANSCYSPVEAIRVGKMLIDAGISHFEEPCPYWEIEQTREVTQALAETQIDVTGGEQDWDFIVWNLIMQRNVVDILQPDVMYMGGITRTLELCKIAHSNGFSVTPHSANLSLVTMATMHLLGAIPNAGKYLELSIEGPNYYPWQQDLFLGDPFHVEDGAVHISHEPGWGVEINPEWLERAGRRESRIECK
jgi:L-alanine-DL-glutamate epimerase-like enolase superfamily enzyme